MAEVTQEEIQDLEEANDKLRLQIRDKEQEKIAAQENQQRVVRKAQLEAENAALTAQLDAAHQEALKSNVASGSTNLLEQAKQSVAEEEARAKGVAALAEADAQAKQDAKDAEKSTEKKEG